MASPEKTLPRKKLLKPVRLWSRCFSGRQTRPPRDCDTAHAPAAFVVLAAAVLLWLGWEERSGNFCGPTPPRPRGICKTQAIPVKESLLREVTKGRQWKKTPQREKWVPRNEEGSFGKLVDPYGVAKADKSLSAPLPWDRNTSEIMVDGMGVIYYLWKHYSRKRPDLAVQHDPHSHWPGRVLHAVQALTPVFGKDRPPSPWEPLIVVFDQPDPEKALGGLKVRSWKCLHKQGPRNIGGVTVGWAQTYVDQSARMRYRCDEEMLFMLELLTRDFDRRQVLVTNEPFLQEKARRFSTVRSVQWLLKEIRHSGEKGAQIVEELLASKLNVDKIMEKWPKSVQRAFGR